MGALRTISRNIVSNAAGHFVAIATALVMTPFVTNALGETGYGIWGLVVSLTGYYGVLDLGLRSAVGQYVTRYWTKGDRDGVNRTINTAIGLTLPVAAALLLVSLVLAIGAPTFFTLREEDVAETQAAIAVLGFAVSLSFPFGVFGSAPYARQRFDLTNLVAIVERLVNVGLAYWVLTAGHGLLGIAVTTAATQLAAWLVRVWMAFRLLPGLSLGVRWFTRSSARELWGFGLHNFVINVADRLVLSTDLILIGIMIADKKAVAYYSYGGDFVGYFVMLVNSVAWTLTPYATACDASGDRPALQRLWVAGSKNIFLFASVIGGGLILLGHDFIRIWLGPQFVSGKEYTSSATILAVLAAATLLRAMMTCGKQVLFGMREVRFLARLSIAEAIANLALSIVLIQWLGLLGVAIGTLIPVICTQLVLQPRFLARRLDLPLGAFLTRVAPGGLLVLATMGVMTLVVHDLVIVTGWSSWLAKAVLVTAPAVAVGAWLGTTPAEKHLVLRKLGLTRLLPDADSGNR